MIKYIHGLITEIDDNIVTLEVNGIGYEVFVTKNAVKCLQLNKLDRVYIFHYKKDDKDLLYGFYDKDEREVFINLIGIPGISFKRAIRIIHEFEPEQLIDIINTNNYEALENVVNFGPATSKLIINALHRKYTEHSSNG